MVYYFALFLAVVKIASANSAIEHVANIHTKFMTVGEPCINEYPVSDDDLTSFKNGQFPESEHAGCFGACVLRNVGLFDDSGNLHNNDSLEKIKGIFTEEEELKHVTELINVCAKVNEEAVTDGEKGCERAKLLYTCFVENSN